MLIPKISEKLRLESVTSIEIHRIVCYPMSYACNLFTVRNEMRALSVIDGNQRLQSIKLFLEINIL